jgi:hypothetical protein
MRSMSVLIGLLALASFGRAQEPAQFDHLVLHTGSEFDGLVTNDQAQQIRFQYLVRKPGVRTLVFETTFDRSEIARLDKASEPGRTLAKQVIAGLLAGKSREEEAAKRLPLKQTNWLSGTEPSWQYEGRYFHLHSNAREDLVRLVCVRLDEIFAAYVNTLPKRQDAAKPTRIILFHSLAEFQEWQQKHGVQFLNPAVYDQNHNEIIVGSDVERLTKELSDLNKKHEGELRAIEEQRQKLFKHFQGQPPAAQLRQLQQLARGLHGINQENEVALANLQAGFFATLYHEAFHAYLDNWVYPSLTYFVPRWLGEGLAQLYENAFVEIGQLRVGRINEKRLQEIQDEVRRGRFISLREILISPPQQFFVRHTLDAFESDRQYAAAWALAHYLTFGLKLLETERFTDYVTKVPNRDEVKAFETLTGQTVDEFVINWHNYLLRLRPDGTLRP